MVVATEEGSRAVEGKAEVVGMEEVVMARRVGSVAAALATEVSGKSHVAAMAERMEAVERGGEMEPAATGAALLVGRRGRAEEEVVLVKAAEVAAASESRRERREKAREVARSAAVGMVKEETGQERAALAVAVTALADTEILWAAHLAMAREVVVGAVAGVEGRRAGRLADRRVAAAMVTVGAALVAVATGTVG